MLFVGTTSFRQSPTLLPQHETQLETLDRIIPSPRRHDGRRIAKSFFVLEAHQMTQRLSCDAHAEHLVQISSCVNAESIGRDTARVS